MQNLRLDTRVSRTQYQYVLQDADAAELGRWTQKLLEKLRTLPELADVDSDQQAGGLQLSVEIDRDKASRFSVLTQAIDDTLYDTFGQRQVSVIDNPTQPVPRHFGGRARVPQLARRDG